MNPLATPMRARVVEESPESFARRLERIDTETALFRRVVANGRTQVRFKLGQTPYWLRFVSEAPAPTAALSLCVQIGPARGWFSLESIGFLGPEWAALFEGLDPSFVQALVVEELASLLAQLIGATGEAVWIADVKLDRRARNDALIQTALLENEASHAAVRATLEQETPGFFSRLATALQRLAPQIDEHSTACLPLQLSLGRAWLSPGDVAQSRPGDVLIFPAAGTPRAASAVCLDCRGTRLPIRALLEGRAGRLVQHNGGDMADETAVPVNGPDGLEEASVPVTAVVGELELPLRELRTIKAGYVFELPTDLEQATVRLYTGRRLVGTGKLVAVGERLGVRLLEWGGSGEQ